MITLSQFWTPKFTDIRLSSADFERFKDVSTGWVYGEITEQGIEEMLSPIPNHKGKFVDLGSGRGNICAYVYLNYGYEECVGIELSEQRWSISEEIKKLAIKEHELSGVSFLHQDLFTYDLSDADVVFSNNIAFGNGGNAKLHEKFNAELKSGAFVVLTRLIADNSICPRMKKVVRTKAHTSWMDACPIHIYQAH